MDEKNVSPENISTISKEPSTETKNVKSNLIGQEGGESATKEEKSNEFKEVQSQPDKPEVKDVQSEPEKPEVKEVQNEPEKSNRNLDLDLECISDTKSEHDPEEELDEYYESISEEEHVAAEVDDISSDEDENFVDTVPKHTFADLPFVPKAEFSSELLNTVKEEKFDSEENNFNRKPFSSSVQTYNDGNNSQFVHKADFSVPPPNFNYATNQNVSFPEYNYDQSVYHAAQQGYGQHPWYNIQANYDQGALSNQQYYEPADYQNYYQTAYQNYYQYQGGYGGQQTNTCNSESNVGVQSASSQPIVPFHAKHDLGNSGQNYQYNPTAHSNFNVVENVNSFGAAKSDSGEFNYKNVTVSNDTSVRRDTVIDSTVWNQVQTADNKVDGEETFVRPVSYKPTISIDKSSTSSADKSSPAVDKSSTSAEKSSAAVDKSSPTADWLDENGDPIKGAFDFVAPDDTDNSTESKSSRIEYVFSVRNSKSAKDTSITTVTDSKAISTTKTVDKKQSVISYTGLSLSEQIAAERAKVSEKELQVDEEKKLYEASKNGEEYKVALQEALATTSLAKVTPSTSKLLAENAVVQKERISRFKRMQFTNQKVEVQPDQPNTAAASIPFKKTEADVALESQAITEILKEVQHGAARAKQYGALGWQKNPVPVVNKTFLHNTLVSTLREPYRPPSKRGGRATQGLKDKREGSRSGSSSRSSRSYSSDSRSSSRSSRSSYSSDSDRSRSRDRHGPPGFYDEAWAAYAAHYGYPWMGPEAYGMYYGPDGWPMDAYNPMFFGEPQAWDDYDAFFGPQNFNPRARGRGFRGRGRDRGRAMDFRGRGRDADFRGRGWGPEFRGGGRGMDFRGRPPRGFPFHPQGRGMGPMYPGRRDFSRSQSRSRDSESDPELRGSSKYEGASRYTSRAGSRKSRSKSKSPRSMSGRKKSRDRSETQSKNNRGENSENESNDKSKKKKRKHKKSKKRKNKSKTESSNDQSKQEEQEGNPNEKPTEQTDGEKTQNKDGEEKVKSKKSKKHSRHKKKEGKHKKDKNKGDKESLAGDLSGKTHDLGKEGVDKDKGDPAMSKELTETRGEHREESSFEKSNKAKEMKDSDKKSKSRSREESRAGSEEKQKKKKKDHEMGGKSGNNKNRKTDGKGKDYRKTRDKKGKHGDYPSGGRDEVYGHKDNSERDRLNNVGEAVENDLRLKLKAKRLQNLLQEGPKNAKAERERTSVENLPGSNLNASTETKSSDEIGKERLPLGEHSGPGKKKVIKKKKIVKKKRDRDTAVIDVPEADPDKEPKQKKIVKKKIIVKRKKVKSGMSELVTSNNASAGIDSNMSSSGKLCESNNGVALTQTEGTEGSETKGVKRKRIVKRKIIVKRKKVKMNPGPEGVQSGGNVDVAVNETHCDNQGNPEHTLQSLDNDSTTQEPTLN